MTESLIDASTLPADATLRADADDALATSHASDGTASAALSWITQLGSIGLEPSPAHGSPASFAASSTGEGTDLLSDLELSRVLHRPSSAPPSSHSGEESSGGSAPHADHASALVFPRLGLHIDALEPASAVPPLRLIVTGGSGAVWVDCDVADPSRRAASEPDRRAGVTTRTRDSCQRG